MARKTDTKALEQANGTANKIGAPVYDENATKEHWIWTFEVEGYDEWTQRNAMENLVQQAQFYYSGALSYLNSRETALLKAEDEHRDDMTIETAEHNRNTAELKMNYMKALFDQRKALYKATFGTEWQPRQRERGKISAQSLRERIAA